MIEEGKIAAVAPAEAAWRARGIARALAEARPSALLARIERERSRWFLWAPVSFGSGIILYFQFPAEPSWIVAAAAPAVALALLMSLAHGLARSLVLGVIVMSAFGFACAKARTEWVRAPVLARALSAVPVTGWVELVEPKAVRGARVTLRVESIGGLGASEVPKRARIGINGEGAVKDLKPGDFIRVTARLAPPSPPALPNDYDFARAAWFSGLGAVGYATGPPASIESPGPPPLSLKFASTIERVRLAIGDRIVAAVPGETGAIANALITGARGGISAATTNAFRNSGLLHIMSISGLHMAVMAGAVFFLIRTLLACFPALVLAAPVKKWAAAAAAIAAFGYLLLSGSATATVRAFIMIAIMFLAVMVDRPALAMRNVAIAALVILGLWPESMYDVGFQMSFAAVVTLIAAYEVVRERMERDEASGPARRLGAFFGGIALSTVIASVAVAPFAAYHFHSSQQFALLANLIAIPVCNIVVMPAGLMTLLLMPFGLESIALPIMAWGIDIMVKTANAVAGLPGAVLHLPAISGLAFGLMVGGGLWVSLWRTRWRVLGVAAVAVGLALAPMRAAPDLLVGRAGALVAVRDETGKLAALAGRGATFDLKRWLEHDGDARTPRQATRAGAYRCDTSGCVTRVRDVPIAIARHPAALADDCARVKILVATIPVGGSCHGPGTIIDYPVLRREGTHALYFHAGGGVTIETVAGARGERPWSARPGDFTARPASGRPDTGNANSSAANPGNSTGPEEAGASDAGAADPDVVDPAEEGPG